MGRIKSIILIIKPNWNSHKIKSSEPTDSGQSEGVKEITSPHVAFMITIQPPTFLIAAL